MSLIADIQKDMEMGAVRLITEYRSRLLSDAQRLCENLADAEDLVSRTFVKVIGRIETHDEGCDLYAWMKTIMVNLHRDDLDHPVARGTVPVDDATLEGYAGADWSTDEQILNDSDSEAIRKAISELDPKYKQAMLMRYYDEFSLKEIANCLTLPMGTVSRRVQIAHRLLAGKLRAEFGRAKKPLAILLAVLLGIGSLFGAWQAGLIEPLFSQSGEADKSGEAYPPSEASCEAGAMRGESFPLHGGAVSTQLQSQSETGLTQEESQSATTKEQTMNAKKLMVAAAVGASALGATANVIYVTPDGAGSGASWADPAPITTAIAAAVEAEGGEVWLKEGWYDLKAAIPLSTNVIVRGGFAGTETSADEADPKAHRTVLSAIVSMASYNWTSNSTRTVNCPLWKDGEFNLCLPTDEVGCVWRIPAVGNGGFGFSNIFTMPDGSTGVKIVGVTFTGSRGTAVIVSASSSIEVESCRFLACGVGTGSLAGGGISADGLVRVKDCEFIGCGGAPLTLGGTDTTVSHKVANCLFYANTGCSAQSRSAAIDVANKTPVEIEGCTFRSNIGLDRCHNSFAGSVIANYNGGAMTIKDCFFEDNRCRNTGTQTTFGIIHATGTVRIENCMFRGNNVKGTDLEWGTACINATGNLIVRNTVFAGNWISATTSKGSAWSVVTVGSSSVGRFINCAFYDNSLSVEGTTDVAKDGMRVATCLMGRRQNTGAVNDGVAFINCLFSNDTLASNVTIPETGSPRQAEVMLDDDTNANRPGFTYSLINTVIWNKSADHRCFREHPEINPWITHCDFVNCGDVEARTNGTTCIEYLTADDPGISPKVCRKRGTYPFKGMLGLALDSPFVKAGTPVYEKDGTFYIYEPELVAKKPWRHCTLKGTSYASLADGATLVADGFGVAREEESFSYGPVVNVPFGFAVMLK